MAIAVRAPLLRLAAVVAVAAAGVGAWYALTGSPPAPPPDGPAATDADPPDPRLTFETPFRNVRPEVHYVGDAACAACHRTIDRTYHAHPMGRSAALVARSKPIEQFDTAAHNPCPAGPYELWVETVDGKQRHHVRTKDPAGNPLPDYIATADLAIGSGTRGRSYVTVQNGEAWQTAISWYGPDARWDLSPGFDLGNGGRRAVMPECMFCHVDRVEPVPGAVNRYREPVPTGQAAIGCERCHGPGELHVAERTTGSDPGPVDTSIVNPKHLAPDLRSAICAQCHLQGEQRVARRGRTFFEFRPGLPLDLFITVYVRHPDVVDLQKSVGQFEQMYRSRCFIESGGKFGCTSCHDPHAAAPTAPAERAAYYRAKCTACHTGPGHECSERPAAREPKADMCTECHMPRTGSSNIVHASVTDHRVPRRPDREFGRAGLPPGTTPVVRFQVGPISPSAEAEGDRDLAVALCRLVVRTASDPGTRALLAADADRLVRGSLDRWPGDVPGWVALAQVCQVQGDWDGAKHAAATATGLAPDCAEAQSALAQALARTGQYEAAVEAATELVRLSPTGVEPRLLRVHALLGAGNVARALADCQAALVMHPLHPGAHLLMAVCRARSGDADGGRREVEIAAGLATSPRQRAAIRDQFRGETGLEPPMGK
jgi:hypothetical protein